jgi:hypothetical protein
MALKRKIPSMMLFWLASTPLLGGTGRPSDGLLSFVLLFGFLLMILGILQLVSILRRWGDEVLEGLY